MKIYLLFKNYITQSKLIRKKPFIKTVCSYEIINKKVKYIADKIDVVVKDNYIIFHFLDAIYTKSIRTSSIKPIGVI